MASARAPSLPNTTPVSSSGSHAGVAPCSVANTGSCPASRSRVHGTATSLTSKSWSGSGNRTFAMPIRSHEACANAHGRGRVATLCATTRLRGVDRLDDKRSLVLRVRDASPLGRVATAQLVADVRACDIVEIDRDEHDIRLARLRAVGGSALVEVMLVDEDGTQHVSDLA